MSEHNGKPIRHRRTNLFYRLADLLGEWAYNRSYKQRMRPDPWELEKHRVNNAKYFDVDEDHCTCPTACEIH